MHLLRSSCDGDVHVGFRFINHVPTGQRSANAITWLGRDGKLMDGARPLALVLTLRTSLPVRFHTFLYGAFCYSSSAKPNEVDDPDAGQTRKGATQVPGTDTSKRCQSSVQLMNYNFELYYSPAIRLALFFQTPKIFQIMLDQSLNCWKKAGNSRYLLHYY